jgi:prepilin peptidase CpaA
MDLPVQIIIVFILIAAMVFDIAYRKIPNILTFPAMLAGMAYYTLTGGGAGLLFSLGGLATGLAVLFILFLIGAMGAGDVKLMGAIGALSGTHAVLNSALFTMVAGAFYALILLLFRHSACKEVLPRILFMLNYFMRTGKLAEISPKNRPNEPKLCYGVAIAAGTFFVLGWQAVNHSLPI